MKRAHSVITCIGLNHLTAPVEEREKLAFSRQELRGALESINLALGGGAVILSTCNRTELYASVPETADQGQRLISLLMGCKGASLPTQRFYVLQHREAVRHLFRVAAGLDSMVLGESQILGQVREAMSIAMEAGALNGSLSRAFHSALSVGKKARTATSIGKHSVSVSSAAVGLVRAELGSLAGKTVLVISAGSTGKLAIKGLTQAGAERVLVTNRTHERALELAENLGASARALPFWEMDQALSEADIVISGTAAGDFILGAQQIARVMADRGHRPLLLIDVAVPRDIDPAVRDVPGVHLLDIDDVEAAAHDGLQERQREVSKVEAIIEEEMGDFLGWWGSLDVLPVVAALRQRAEEIRINELQRTLKRLPDLDEESRQRIEAMTAAIVKKMLDRPIARLKDGADTGLYMEALQDLFGLRAGKPLGPERS